MPGPSSVTQRGRFEPFELQVSRGDVAYHTPLNIFGLTSTLGSTAYGPAWEGLTPSGGNYVYPSSAAQMWIYSSSASDTAVSVVISGLDANYNILTEIIAVNGTTAVQTVNSYFRINGMGAIIGTPVGNISLYSNSAKTGGTLYAQITAGNGNSQMSIYTVPNGYTFYQTYFQADANTGVTSSAYNKVRTVTSPPINNGVAASSSTLFQSVFVQSFNTPLSFPLAIPAKTDTQWQLLASTGTSTVANIYVGGVLIANQAG